MRLSGLLALASALCAPAAQAAVVYPANVALNVKDFGAWGDSIHDDTRAIQRALDTNRTENIDYNGRPKTLYFPAGVYRVSDSLTWRGCAMTLMGEGADASIIRLSDNCAGFTSSSAPKSVLRSPAGNMSFRQNVHGLTIDVGRGNAGAIALNYISSNSGTVRDVQLVSQDGFGYCGLDMTRAWPGPLLIRNVRVRGFDYGIRVAHSEYGPTFEGITLEQQRIAGFYNDGNICAVRALVSDNTVPAFVNVKSYAYLILLDAVLGGGASGHSAIESEGFVYLRNVSSGGSAYASALAQGGTVSPGHYHREYLSGAIQKLWTESPDQSLNLPVQDAPVYHDPDTSQWARFRTRWYGDTGLLQDLLNSGKTTVYFPAGVYFCHTMATFTVPASVRRIIGFHGVINHEVGESSIRFQVAESSSEPLIIEQFGYGVGVEHLSSRTVAIKHGKYAYTGAAGAGDVFFEDVETDDLVFRAGQRVWMRQLNTEGPGLHVTNEGARVWILGVKTEGKGTVVHTRAGGATEVLGTLLYPCQSFTATDGPAFIIEQAAASFMYRVSSYVTNGNYPIQVRETRDTEMREWRLTTNTASICPLFVGFDSTQIAVRPAASAAVAVPWRAPGVRRLVVCAGSRETVVPVGRVYDMAGRPVRRLVHAGALPSGTYVLAPGKVINER
jgi:hypothetical protein